MQLDLAIGGPRVGPAVTGAQVSIGQYVATVVIQSVSGFGEPLRRHHRDVVHLWTLTQRDWLGRRRLSRDRRNRRRGSAVARLREGYRPVAGTPITDRSRC